MIYSAFIKSASKVHVLTRSVNGLLRGRKMAFMVKQMVGGHVKNLTGGLTEEKPEGEKSEAAAAGMTQEEFEQYQQQLEEEK